MPGQSRERSVSGDVEDSDIGSPQENGQDHDNVSGSKPGRKKNPNSQAARRDQNRIAQREFRLRKQQRIRDLEASVEILSGGKDEALTQLRKIMKDLMQENQVLRNLLRSLSSFIGDGAGGVLPKMGWTVDDFHNFLNRSETDTAWESYQRHKGEEAASGSSQKRPSDDDASGSRSKRARGPGEKEDGRNGDAYPLIVPMNQTVPPVPASNLYPPPPSRNAHESSLFSELLRGPSGSPMFVPPTSPPNATGQYPSPTASTVSGGHNSYQTSYMPPINVNVDPALPAMSLVNNNVSTNVAASSQSSPDEAEQDPKREEAHKLIQYHLDNYKRNTQYCLPSSLRPTLVQRTIPHESVIDNILHPELRDRMILLRGRFDLVDCMHEYRTAVTIHGDDVLAHSNWEISEAWLQRYKFLVDKNTLTIVNRWRRERNEPELNPADYSSTDPPSV
ncbi:hypothetical protein BXZ70DRAFT_918655 [Cristinia sonorae]|uniref:BZIP domain-containing protein n=1 Tax=Cristinia sonorae TaxID=1940300 RepID=A0A8K0UWG2_9AGAR|nr:hypothetical protein BXZ70DRAFT_918655 [Cristinia sonorae]